MEKENGVFAHGSGDHLPPVARVAHLVGAAGAGMRALADVLLGSGWQVTGSDSSLAGVCRRAADCQSALRRSAGWQPAPRIVAGHAAENVPLQADVVIVSDAVPADNPEVRRAKELGIPVCSYFEMLGRLMEGQRGLAVAGTHGKSTTTAMAGHILAEAGRDPTVVCGATPLGHKSGGRASRGAGCQPAGKEAGWQPAPRAGVMLVEACEYRANFLHLHPQQAVILGIDHDHFDCFDTLGDVERAFRKFAARIPNDGLILARHDCQITRRVTDGLMCRTETFGFDQAADWSARSTASPARQGGDDAADGTYPRAYAQGSPDEASVLPVSSHGQDGPGRCVQPGCSAFAVHHRGRHLVDVQLRLPGRHNVLNALAAAALAWHNGVAPARIARGLASFRGLHRRLERLGTWRGTTLIDDYAHHPTEVAVSLETVRQMYPERRVFCVFQPHQALRTARLLDELAASLHNAHWVAVADIFRAREGPFRSGEVTAADLARRVQGLLTVEVATVHRLDEIARVLENRLRPGDVLVTLGAGDIARIYDGFLEESRESRAAG